LRDPVWRNLHWNGTLFFDKTIRMMLCFSLQIG
jgi:hypothetical protein